ncbi:XRE family transcriptional regulator [Actinoplanes sp. NPDC049596]|uniref:XRE family transcriptional regulator n=1 Tax=unclassified Actinoplanes TaxID=2626549 RepID=UPI00343F4DDF
MTQAQLANALAQRKATSVQLISSWERPSNPARPPEDRLHAIATFFCTRRSLEGAAYHLLDDSELTDDERAERERLWQELLELRQAAPASTGGGEASPAGETGAEPSIVGRGPWHFADGAPIIIVCSELPPNQLPPDTASGPDSSELARVADLDALFEVHGHIRAVNPDSEVQYRSAGRLRRDDFTAHLVLLGGIDWNAATKDTMRLTGVPVRQHSHDDDPLRGCFEVTEKDNAKSFSPEWDGPETGRALVQDVGHFLRAPNPFNRSRTVTVCNGMYAIGTFGAVRTLTDKVFRDENADYLTHTFGDASTFSVLFRINIVNGVLATPDWTAPDTVLHTWSEAAS